MDDDQPSYLPFLHGWLGLAKDIASLAKSMSPSGIAVSVDNAVRTGTGTADYLRDRSVARATHDVLVGMASLLRDLKFSPTGIRMTIHELALNPSAEIASKFEAQVKDNIGLIKRCVEQGRTNKEVVARNKVLIDRIDSIHDRKNMFYSILGADVAQFHRDARSGRKFTRARRQEISDELEVTFEQINKEIDEALTFIEMHLNNTRPAGHPHS